MSFPTPDEIRLYRRQLKLPEIGLEGQRRLREASVLIMGAGGLGIPASIQLAAAGVRHLRLAEGDMIELSNLPRQPIYTERWVGSSKGAAWLAWMREFFPRTKVEWTGDYFSRDTAEVDLSGIQLALDCADNLPASFLLHDEAMTRGIPFVSAGLHRWEIQLASYLPGHEGGCLRCLWPDEPPADCAGSCAETGILGAVASAGGSMQALEAIRIITEGVGAWSSTQLLMDLRTGTTQQLKRKVKPACAFCSSLHKGQERTAVIQASEMEVLPQDSSLGEFSDYKVIDLREVGEPGFPLPEALPHVVQIPLSGLKLPHPELDPSGKLLLVCAHGVRSLYVTASLRANGFENAWSLKGGMEGVAEMP
jgi:molybdopterin/thiamine biosynthesis adenylyltransferase/rhodanese-related sulfurtransferase